MTKTKIIRITTVPISLDKLLEGQLRYMSSNYEVIAVSSSDGKYLEKIAHREGVHHYPIELTRSITPLADIKSLWQMYLLLRREKPTIVHTHTPKAGTIGMIASKLAGIPIRLHTVAGLPLLETTGAKRKLLNFVERVTYSMATKVLPNSIGLRNIILENNFCRIDKLEVIAKGSSNGIDTTYFDPSLYNQSIQSDLRLQLGISKDNYVFIFVGRIVRDKGIVELITAFKNLDNPNSKLLLVGSFESELDPLPQTCIAEIRSNNNIIHVGWQDDVRPYFAIADALTFPSYREGFPNVVMQAGAMNLLSIVSNINGCNEIIKNGYNGLIIPVKNIKALRLAMEEVIQNDYLSQKLKSNARKSITENYERRYVWSALYKFYSKEVLEKTKSSN